MRMQLDTNIYGKDSFILGVLLILGAGFLGGGVLSIALSCTGLGLLVYSPFAIYKERRAKKSVQIKNSEKFASKK